MQHPEEGIIHAWLDGALPANEAAEIEAHAASCPECAARVAEARGLIAASSRIVGHLDHVPGNVIPIAKPKKRALWQRSVWPVAIAASLLISIRMVQSRQSPLVASGQPDSVVAPIATVPPGVKDSSSAIAAQHTLPLARRAPVKVSEIKPDTPPLPAANVAMQKASAAEPQPAPLAASAPRRADQPVAQSRMTASSEVDRAAMERSSVGAVAGGAASSSPTTIGASDRMPDTLGFAGCYELVGARSPAAPMAGAPRGAMRSPAGAPQQMPNRLAQADVFERFALTDESAPTPGLFAVRQLDAGGRLGNMIVGAGWVVENDRAVLKGTDGRTIVTLMKSGSAIRGVTSDGDRTTRIISCRK